MKTQASFQVDPKLAELLGETYKSTEDAIKELVDNAFDADADNVWVKLPKMGEGFISVEIRDDGHGMKEEEVRNEYLKIASSRSARKGNATMLKKRKVKGRKGIGKFAGLMVAEVMTVVTKSSGRETTLEIKKSELAKSQYDLEKVDLPVNVNDCNASEHGTTIILTGVNDNFEFPNPEKLKQILVWEYGRANDFNIFVDDDKVGVQDVKGQTFEKKIELPDGKQATIKYTIADKPVKGAGIIYRVDDKIVGRPKNFLAEHQIIPDKLQKRVIGEIICDDLKDAVSSDWGNIFENSKLNAEIKQEVEKELENSLGGAFKTEMSLAKARHQKKINQELEKLPEYKRQFAEKSLQKVLEKFYGESDEKVNTIISVMIDALDKDYYWNVVKNIEDARDGDVEKFADALSEFGIAEVAAISSQATNRTKFLDELDFLRTAQTSNEGTMHKALDKNAWVFGSEYTTVFSNQTLKKVTEDYLDKKYKGDRAGKRPDLLLGINSKREYELIEFKNPQDLIGRDAEAQALKYRDDLQQSIHQKISIRLVGGRVDSKISSQNEREDVRYCTYAELISEARNNLSWLLKELMT